ncbi:hypothetical protein [Streptomyces sp. NPDC047014]|uniref:hypothetical protein n=1 Tax=Streptomyces sp. NPDC047014 TaxID=3155736 RepID=UPI0033FCF5F6
MSFDEEWSAARATARSHAALRLNQAPAAPGPGSGPGAADLALPQDRIGAIGSEAYALHHRLQTDARHAATATSEAAAALTKEGFAAGAALLTAHTRWESQVKTLVAACANISNGLSYSLQSHAKDEAQLHADLTASAVDSYLK